MTGEPANGDDVDDGLVEPTMAVLLDDLAEEFADVQRRDGPDGVDYLVCATVAR